MMLCVARITFKVVIISVLNLDRKCIAVGDDVSTISQRWREEWIILNDNYTDNVWNIWKSFSLPLHIKIGIFQLENNKMQYIGSFQLFKSLE